MLCSTKQGRLDTYRVRGQPQAVFWPPIGNNRCQLRDGLLRDGEKLRIAFYSDARVSDGTRCSNGRTPAHKGIEDETLTKGKRGTHDLAHECLRFEGRMRSDITFSRAGRRALDDIAEWLIVGDPTKSPRLPLAQVVLNATLARFSEEAPRFPAGAGHDSDIFELVVRVLRPVSAAESLNQADDLTALFEAGFNEGYVDQLRKKWIRSDKDVATRHENPKGVRAPLPEEFHELLLFFIAENGEPRQWSADTPTDRRGNSPNTAMSAPEFSFLFGCVFFQTIGRICDDGMNAVGLTALHPLEAILLHKLVCSFDGLVDRSGFSNRRWESGWFFLIVAVVAKCFPQDCRSFGGVLCEDLSDVSRQVTRKDQERDRISLADFGNVQDGRPGWPSLAPLKSGNVSLGDPKSFRDIGLRQPTPKAGILDMLSKLEHGPDLLNPDGSLFTLHSKKSTMVYRISQPCFDVLPGNRMEGDLCR